MTAKIAALFGVAALAVSSSAFAAESTKVVHVYQGRTVVPVTVKQDQAPYALTGREQAAKKQLEPIKVGARTAGYQVR